MGRGGGGSVDRSVGGSMDQVHRGVHGLGVSVFWSPSSFRGLAARR